MTDIFERFEYGLMKKLLALAEKQKGKTGKNPLVASAVYDDYQHIISMACHESEGSAHAEVLALNYAGSQAENQHLMVTLEPCTHVGATPPCVEAIIRSKVKRVVYAVDDPNPAVRKTPAAALLKEAGIKVESPFMPDEAADVNAVFFKNQTTNLPFVTMKMALSLDGKIAPSNRNSQYITGVRSLKQVHRLRREHDAILVGSGTISHDDPQLTVRYNLLKGGYSNPIQIILDPMLSCPLDAKLLRVNSSDTVHTRVIFVCNNTIQTHALAGFDHVTLWPLITDDGHLQWSSFLEKCYAYGICSLLIEGGQHVFSSALSSGMVDQLELFMAPLLIAGTSALSPFCINRFLSLEDAITVKNMQVRQCKPDIWIRATL